MLFDLGDERILKYDKEELLRILGDNRYHSPEDSVTDSEETETRTINVYNPSWRSDEVRYFFRNLFIIFVKILTNSDI